MIRYYSKKGLVINLKGGSQPANLLKKLGYKSEFEMEYLIKQKIKKKRLRELQKLIKKSFHKSKIK